MWAVPRWRGPQDALVEPALPRAPQRLSHDGPRLGDAGQGPFGLGKLSSGGLKTLLLGGSRLPRWSESAAEIRTQWCRGGRTRRRRCSARHRRRSSHAASTPTRSASSFLPAPLDRPGAIDGRNGWPLDLIWSDPAEQAQPVRLWVEFSDGRQWSALDPGPGFPISSDREDIVVIPQGGGGGSHSGKHASSCGHCRRQGR